MCAEWSVLTAEMHLTETQKRDVTLLATMLQQPENGELTEMQIQVVEPKMSRIRLMTNRRRTSTTKNQLLRK